MFKILFYCFDLLSLESHGGNGKAAFSSLQRVSRSVSLLAWVFGASRRKAEMRAPCPAHEEGRRGLGHSGGRGHGRSELDEGRTTCFHLGVLETAAWRRKGAGAGPWGHWEGREGCFFRQRQSRMNRNRGIGIPAQKGRM